MPACVYLISFRRCSRCRPLKLPLSCKSPKRWFLGPRFVEGRDTPDFWHAFSNYTYFRPCGRIWFSSVRGAQRLEGEKRKKKEERKKEESLVKYKSADNYVGRPNKLWEWLLGWGSVWIYVFHTSVIVAPGWTFVVSRALYARELLKEPLDITLLMIWLPPLFLLQVSLSPVPAPESWRPQIQLWSPVFNVQEKTTVHFHTQYALCTRMRVRVYIHTGQTRWQSTSVFKQPVTQSCYSVPIWRCNTLEWEIQILNKITFKRVRSLSNAVCICHHFEIFDVQFWWPWTRTAQGHPMSKVKLSIESPFVVSYLTSIVSNIVAYLSWYSRYLMRKFCDLDLGRFKVIQGQRSWCQSMAQGRFRIRLPLTPSWYLSPFSRYLTLKLFFIGCKPKVS